MDKFEGIDYRIGETGAPIVIDNAVSHLEARVTKEMDVGTHTILVGEVVNADVVAEHEACMTYEYSHRINVCPLPFRASGQVQPASGNRRGVGSARTLRRYRCLLQFVR